MDKDQAISVIRRDCPSAIADLLTRQLQASARLVRGSTGEATRGGSPTSHLGGMPWLPPGVDWPVWDNREYLNAEIARLEDRFRTNPRATGLRDIAVQMREHMPTAPIPLPFLAQLSLRELHLAAPIPGWPTDGWLTFFYEWSAWGYDPLCRGHCRAMFFAPDTILAPASAPEQLAEHHRLSERSVRFKLEWTLPSAMTFEGHDSSNWSYDEHTDLCEQLISESSRDTPMHRCGGHPQEIQGDMRLECQLVSNGLYCGNRSGYEDPRRAVLEPGAADWKLLLQIDSDEEQLGCMFGDSGRVYFWARQQDIAAGDFDNSWAILQCY
jgi:uncharacterized protein YwqG